MFGKKKNNIIVLGADGMLGHDVAELLMREQKREQSCIGIVTALTHHDISIELPYSLSEIVSREYPNPPVKYDYVINCAAMTDTAKIEADSEYRDKAYAVNAVGPKNIARTCAYHKIKLIHISTDYVYSQRSILDSLPFHSTGYSEIDALHISNGLEFPVNTYGMQKLIAEKFIKETMKKSDYAILRTSWLYGAHNSKSFVHKLLKNFMAQKREHEACFPGKVFEFGVTQNELSVPTRSETLAKMVLNAIKHNLHGTFAACGTSASSSYAVSRKEWAEEILKLWLKPEELASCKVVGIDRNTLAPKYSRMYNSLNSRDYLKLYNGADYTWQQDLCWFLSMHKGSIEKFLSC